MYKDDISPLGEYLISQKMTQVQFCAAILAARGWTVTQPCVSRWANGTTIPGRMSQMHIAVATGGKVTPEKWARYASQTRKSAA